MTNLIVLLSCRSQGTALRGHAPRRRGGFTLIELVITVTIISVLATAALPMAEVAAQRSKEQELRTALRQIRNAIDAYKQAVEEGRIESSLEGTGYPKSLNQLIEGVNDLKSPKEMKIFFLRRIPRDPLARDPAMPSEATWGKRSYTSSADAPQEGDDVYDVYSTSQAVGLNGVPYREW